MYFLIINLWFVDFLSFYYQINGLWANLFPCDVIRLISSKSILHQISHYCPSFALWLCCFWFSSAIRERERRRFLKCLRICKKYPAEILNNGKFRSIATWYSTYSRWRIVNSRCVCCALSYWCYDCLLGFYSALTLVYIGFNDWWRKENFFWWNLVCFFFSGFTTVGSVSQWTHEHVWEKQREGFCVGYFEKMYAWLFNLYLTISLSSFTYIWFILLVVSASLKSKLQKRKLSSAGESIEYRCLIRATDAKKTISTSVKLILVYGLWFLSCTLKLTCCNDFLFKVGAKVILDDQKITNWKVVL